jgi:quinoprotein dehydrogenase-associated probable ABC transporter substrate-binding protein
VSVLRVSLIVLGVCLVCPALGAGQAPPAPPIRQADSARGPQFRVCADPENLPFSHRNLTGFENRIATLLAKDFGAMPSYIWWGQRQGFIRNTMNATLAEGRCDIVLGVPVGYDLVRTTKPYYRSTYVFVYPKSRKTAITSLDDPVLKKLKIGVHLLGNDYENPPPVHELGKRHIVDNVRGFNTFYSADNPPSAIVDAVATGEIDVAIVWGPIAGYYASRQRVPLAIVPIPSRPGDLPFAFDISMGVKKGNAALYTRLEQLLEQRRPEIQQILKEYGVPLLDGKAITKR